ncbi:chaperonin 10-like protein [Suillus plorans]|uniref:Chaperonin 10-like protein n=1 Tax=Suillus plorans TaxID=116603 RepID=A0A9P7J9V4_9AGAM|nr:chaperonin 10-like protein [Suillus plorans]KAG1810140.1 chaperonin 10-like protein [Suillus plorans]
MSDNPSFVLKGILDTEIKSQFQRVIGANEILVEVKKTGICGTDVHFLVHGSVGNFIVEKPMVLGHESAGVVSKVGPGVTNVKVGDRVAMEPAATCRKCEACKEGRYQASMICPDIICAATPPTDGTLTRYYRLPSDLAYPLPPSPSLEDGALMEPLSVAVHAVSKLGALRSNQSVAVFGCGPVGLLCMAVAKALGASRVIAVDVIPDRLEFAKTYAATDTFLPPSIDKGESGVEFSIRNAQTMKEKLGIAENGSRAIDLVLDASGVEVAIQTGIRIAKSGGTFVQVGIGNRDITIDMFAVLCKELVLKGSLPLAPGDYSLAIALVASGKVDVKSLVSHRFSFRQACEAFEITRNGKSPDGKGVIKVMISGPDVDINEV